MNKVASDGFTIIEVVLFLAISSLLLVGVIASSSNSVSQQRYSDTVYSLQSSLQDQYTETFNARNSLSTNISCAADATVTYTGSKTRGQSDCVILGRYLTPSEDGKILQTYPVIGSKTSTPAGSDDLSVLQSYTMKTIPDSLEEVNLEWGVAMQKATPASTATFSLLILRSPSSGVIRTFISEESSAPITKASLLNAESMSRSLLICLDSNDLSNLGRRMGVKIVSGASSTSGVQFIGSDTLIADGGCA